MGTQMKHSLPSDSTSSKQSEGEQWGLSIIGPLIIIAVFLVFWPDKKEWLHKKASPTPGMSKIEVSDVEVWIPALGVGIDRDNPIRNIIPGTYNIDLRYVSVDDKEILSVNTSTRCNFTFKPGHHYYICGFYMFLEGEKVRYNIADLNTGRTLRELKEKVHRRYMHP